MRNESSAAMTNRPEERKERRKRKNEALSGLITVSC